MIGSKNDIKNNNIDIIKMFVISFLTSLFVVFCFTPYFIRNAIMKAARHPHGKQINVVNINGIPIYHPLKECYENGEIIKAMKRQKPKKIGQ